MLILWIIVLALSLAVLLKGSDYLLESAERVGLIFGMSPFIIGVVIVGLGTSFPELISSIVAIIQGQNEIVAANAIGSNIANILLIVGFSAVVAKKLVISKDLIDLDLPLLCISTFIFFVAAYDGLITRPESFLLVVTFIIYFLYALSNQDESKRYVESIDLIPDTDTTVVDINNDGRLTVAEAKKEKLTTKDVLVLVVGLLMLVLGSKYLIDSVVAVSQILNLATGAVTLAAVAIGTSLPELLVSIKAIRMGRPEVVLGNIFGSNTFNLLIVVGLPGLFTQLPLDLPTLTIGLPALLIATILFVFSGISRKIHMWEGGMFLLLYVFFIGKLFQLI